jgi:hypothetical protein
MEKIEVPEMIVCAAIWYEKGRPFSHHPTNITQGTVIFGLRHNIFDLLIMLYPNYKQDLCTHQGFLTTKNRFVERDEALKIAINAKQVSEDLRGNRWLYSEDLY